MPLTQSFFLEAATDLREGTISMSGPETTIMSGYNADTVVIPFGYGLTFSAAAGAAIDTHEDAGLILPTTLNQVIRGVALATDTIERMPSVTVDGSGRLGYPLRTAVTNRMVSYLTKGVIAVRAAEAIVKGDPVFCVYAAGATRGQFAKSTLSTTATACPTTWEWLTTTASGSLGLIYLK